MKQVQNSIRSLLITLIWIASYSTSAQSYADPNYYLIDSLDLNAIDQTDSLLIAEGLHKYYAAKSDTARLSAIAYIIGESWNEFVYGSYNEFILSEAERLYPIHQDTGIKKYLYHSYCYGIYLRGLLATEKSNYIEGLSHYEELLALKYIETKQELLADSYGNMALCYRRLGQYESSALYTNKALEIREIIKDSLGLANSYNSLAALFVDVLDYEAALENYRMALAINIQQNNDYSMAVGYNNIAVVQNNYYDDVDSAIYYYKMALNIFVKGAQSSRIAVTYSNMGEVFFMANQLDSANYYYSLARKIGEETGSTTRIADGYNNLAYVAEKKGNMPEALNYAIMANDLFSDNSDLAGLKSSALQLSRFYPSLGDYKNGYKYLKQYYKLRDSINNESNARMAIHEQERHEYSLRSIADSIAYEQSSKLDKIELERQDALISKKQTENWLLYGGITLSLIFAVLVLRSYRRKKKDNRIILEQKRMVEAEKERSEELLLNILPAETAEELKKSGQAKARNYDMVTVLFTDFKGFTMLSEKLSPTELVAEIDHCYKAFDKITEACGIEKIKTIGDAYMAAGGLPGQNLTNPEDTVNAALKIRDFMLAHKAKCDAENRDAFEIRIGVHTGPVVAGIVGIKKFAYDIWGDTVNTAARMESSGVVGKVNISGTTYALVSDQFECEYRGKIPAKNKGDIDMYFVN